MCKVDVGSLWPSERGGAGWWWGLATRHGPWGYTANTWVSRGIVVFLSFKNQLFFSKYKDTLGYFIRHTRCCFISAWKWMVHSDWRPCFMGRWCNHRIFGCNPHFSRIVPTKPFGQSSGIKHNNGVWSDKIHGISVRTCIQLEEVREWLSFWPKVIQENTETMNYHETRKIYFFLLAALQREVCRGEWMGESDGKMSEFVGPTKYYSNWRGSTRW